MLRAESSWRLDTPGQGASYRGKGEGADFLGMKALLSLPLKIPKKSCQLLRFVPLHM